MDAPAAGHAVLFPGKVERGGHPISRGWRSEPHLAPTPTLTLALAPTPTPIKVEHGGHPISRGLRYIIVLFMGYEANRMSGREPGYTLRTLDGLEAAADGGERTRALASPILPEDRAAVDAASRTKDEL